MRLLPADHDLLSLSCVVSTTAWLASATGLAHTVSPAWAGAAVLLDAVSVVVVIRAIQRVGTWSAASEGLTIARGVRLGRTSGAPCTVRIELRAAALSDPQRATVVAAVITGAAALPAFTAVAGRPEHWIVGLGVLAALASATTLVALPVVTLIVDIELGRVRSSAGAFTLRRGASLTVTTPSRGGVSHALVIEGLEAAPLVAVPNVEREQLCDLARTLAALLCHLEVTTPLALPNTRASCVR